MATSPAVEGKSNEAKRPKLDGDGEDKSRDVSFIYISRTNSITK